MDRMVFRAGLPGGTLGLSAWETLKNYQSEGLLKHQLQICGEQSPSPARVDDITAHIRQAENYFMAATSSDIMIRPLIVYYGCLALARAAILILSPGMTVERLKPSHGMSIAVRNPRSGDPNNVAVKIGTAGTFRQFVEVTKNITIMRNFGSDGVVGNWKHRSLPLMSCITLDEILCRIPDLIQQNFRRGMSQSIARVRKIELKDDGVLTIYFFEQGIDYAPPLIEMLEWFCPDHRKTVEIFDTISFSGSMADIDWPPVWHLHKGRSAGAAFDGECFYLIKPFSCTVDLSKPAATLALAFALSSCARYYPAMWRAILDGRAGNATPSIISSLSYIYDRFPEMIVDIVEQQVFFRIDAFLYFLCMCTSSNFVP